MPTNTRTEKIQSTMNYGAENYHPLSWCSLLSHVLSFHRQYQRHWAKGIRLI